jgi:hypothetical protein
LLLLLWLLLLFQLLLLLLPHLLQRLCTQLPRHVIILGQRRCSSPQQPHRARN